MPISGSTKALEYSRLKVLRLGASRLGYYQPIFRVYINGVDQTAHVRLSNCTITQELNGRPDTMSCRLSGITVTAGQAIQVFLGDTSTTNAPFAGHILSASVTYEGGLTTNVAYDLSCIDYTWRLSKRKVIGTFANVSASAIVTSMMASFASFATVRHVAVGLPAISIAFTNEDLPAALDQVASAIGAYWYFDYAKDLHFFVGTEGLTAHTVTDANDFGWSLDEASGGNSASSLSQTRTRAIAIGKGSQASTNVPAGSTTLPLLDGSPFSSGGGVAQTGGQRLSYSGKSSNDGQGSLTAGIPGSSPSPPSVSQATPFASGNLAVGAFGYKVTFISALGESGASGSVSASITGIPQPPTLTTDAGVISAAQATGGSLAAELYAYVVTFVTASGECGYAVVDINSVGATGAWVREVNVDASHNAVALTTIPISGDTRVTKRRIYRAHFISGVFPSEVWSAFQLVTTINDNTTTSVTDTVADASLGATMPTIDTGSTGQMAVGIAIGPAGTTARKIYRTVIGGSSYALQSTVSDNTTTSVTDNIADGSLGAALTAATLGANPTDSTLAITDLTSFPNGGWARIGSQVIKFTGRSASSGSGNLTGIPPFGSGAITAFIPSGAAVVNEPFILGIPASGSGAIAAAVTGGDSVNIRVETDDATAQSALAALIGDGDDGVVEAVVGTDDSWDLATCASENAAELALYKNPVSSLHGVTRDPTVQIGRTVTFTRTNPPISATLQIQRVVITEIAVGGGTTNYVWPKREVDASTIRQSFEDLLRRLIAAS